MQPTEAEISLENSIQRRSEILLHEHQWDIYRRTDRIFVVLMILQWLGGIAAALWISPRNWTGTYSQVHVHVLAAVFLGGAISIFPIMLALMQPGRVLTRNVVAVGQMLMSALLIHLTGGRIETHFHVFGSLAFLAFYRDWRVLIPATIVVAADHFLRGIYWPQSVYGIAGLEPWRWLEHAGWVLFEDAFLVTAILQSVAEMRQIAERRAQLEATNQIVEAAVDQRTAELATANKSLQEEIEERSQAERRLSIQYGVAVSLGNASTIQSGIAEILQTIGETLDWDLGEFWEVDGADHVVVRRNAWKRPLPELERFEAFGQGLRYERGRGLPGVVWEKACVVWVEELEKDLNVPRFREAYNAGLRSCVGIPVMLKGEVVGILVFFSRRIETPDAKLVRMFEAIGREIGQVTESKKSHEALQKSEAKFRSLCNCSPVGIFVTDKDKSCIYTNPQWQKIAGLTLKESLGDGWSMAIHPDDRDKTLKAWSAATAKGRDYSGTFRVQTPQNEERWIDCQATTLRSDDGIISGYVGTVEDTTEKRLLEEELWQSHKLEAIGQLAGGISHDFNNVLATIVGHAKQALDNVKEKNSLWQDLSQILKASYRGKEIIARIAAFSRKNTALPSRDACFLGEIVEEAAKLIRPTIPSTVEIQTIIPRDISPIQADPTQMHQVIVNLCINAAQAMPMGGRLVVKLTAASVTEADCSKFGGSMTGERISPGRYSVLNVEDTGHGIKQEIMPRIFEPFFTTKKVGEGSGMGLAVVHGIVKSHGGHIHVYSEENRGTSIKVYLPATEFLGQPMPSGESPVRGGNESILIVDDEEPLAKIVGRSLRSLGYRTCIQTSSMNALQLFKCSPKEEYDLVIVDGIMPGLTGDRLAEEISRVRPGIPIILFTGFSSILSKEALSKAGIRSIISKPALDSALEREVRNLLDEVKHSVAA